MQHAKQLGDCYTCACNDSTCVACLSYVASCCDLVDLVTHHSLSALICCTNMMAPQHSELCVQLQHFSSHSMQHAKQLGHFLKLYMYAATNMMAHNSLSCVCNYSISAVIQCSMQSSLGQFLKLYMYAVTGHMKLISYCA